MKAVTLYNKGMYLVNGIPAETAAIPAEEARRGTIAYSILEAHNVSGNMDKLQIKFDALVSHDITYVGIIQTARASGLKEFPIPYAMTNCHNSLCAVGGTINEDDHVFGLSAAKKYGGIFVPPHVAVIHQYMREMHAGCGKMILGSDSHTRYGALGTMAIGEVEIDGISRFFTSTGKYVVLANKWHPIPDDYEVELVSGITSFCAAAARLNLPLTEWDEPLHLVPGVHETRGSLREPGTYVLMKASSRMAATKKLLRNSKKEVFAVENCGMENEKIYRSVREIPDNTGYFSLVIAKQDRDTQALI